MFKWTYRYDSQTERGGQHRDASLHTSTVAEPTLQQVFGAGATQTATAITILKADLPGLTASATNRAEALLAGVILRAEISLTPAARNADPEISIAIEPGFDSIVNRGTAVYYQSAREITLQKANTSAAIDPDDY